MTTQRLHRLAEHRRKRKAAQARNEQLSAQADDLALHLRGTRIEATRDSDQLTLTLAEQQHATSQVTAGLVAIGIGAAIWWDNNIPLINITPAPTPITLLIVSGLLITLCGLLSREHTWTLKIPVNDPVVTQLREHSETIAALRRLAPEPGRYDTITREKRRRKDAITSHPSTELRRTPSLLSRTIAALRTARR